MKTSFFFVMWIVIYPILALFHNPTIDEHSFLIAIAVVWGLSWALSRAMPKTIDYENESQIAPILEDVYTGNVKSFTDRLTKSARIETIGSIYFLVTTIVVLFNMANGISNEWFTLCVFAFFTIVTIYNAVRQRKALSAVKANPTAEQCMETATDFYQLDYASYYQKRQHTPYSEILPPAPAHFKAFLIFSIVFAAICSVLGTIFTIIGTIGILSETNIIRSAISLMFFLYGTLAIYFGLKDFFSILAVLRPKAPQPSCA